MCFIVVIVLQPNQYNNHPSCACTFVCCMWCIILSSHINKYLLLTKLQEKSVCRWPHIVYYLQSMWMCSRVFFEAIVFVSFLPQCFCPKIYFPLYKLEVELLKTIEKSGTVSQGTAGHSAMFFITGGNTHLRDSSLEP